MSEYSDRDVHREVTELEGRSTTAARLFDVRRIIGGLFVLYGVIVTLAGLTASRPPTPTSTRPRASTSTSGRGWECWPWGCSSWGGCGCDR